jgi:hypothetical protein
MRRIVGSLERAVIERTPARPSRSPTGASRKGESSPRWLDDRGPGARAVAAPAPTVTARHGEARQHERGEGDLDEPKGDVIQVTSLKLAD